MNDQTNSPAIVQNVFDAAWLAAPKEKDPNWLGSQWELLGYSEFLCPTCKAHLKDDICLNACHLTANARAAMNGLQLFARQVAQQIPVTDLAAPKKPPKRRKYGARSGKGKK